MATIPHRTVLLSLTVAGAVAVAFAACSDGAPGQGDGRFNRIPYDPAGQGSADPAEAFQQAPDSGLRPKDAICARSTAETVKFPLDLFFVIDRSKSMEADAKWTSISDALRGFLSGPGADGLGVALQYFPLRRICAPEEYTTPAVPFVALPADRARVAGSIGGQLPESRDFAGTPMLPALTAAVATAKEQAMAHPERRVAVVLATDGYPEGCAAGDRPNTPENVMQAARDAFIGSPSVPVYVLGIGQLLQNLDGIAAAGGSSRALLVDTAAGDLSTRILRAMDEIRLQAIPCEFDLTAANAAGYDPLKTNIVFRKEPAAEAEYMSYVPSAAGCEAAGEHKAWYFDDAEKPTKVVFCSTACRGVKAAVGGQVEIEHGCPRVELGVR